MPPLAPVTVAVVAALAILLLHRDPRSLRNGHTLLGVYTGLAGAAVSFVYAYQVSATIFDAGSTDNCAAAFGLHGDRSSLRDVVSVTEQQFPPRVFCGCQGRSLTLTDASSTDTWVHAWWASVFLLGISVLLLLWGLIRTRGWKKRTRVTT